MVISLMYPMGYVSTEATACPPLLFPGILTSVRSYRPEFHIAGRTSDLGVYRSPELRATYAQLNSGLLAIGSIPSEAHRTSSDQRHHSRLSFLLPTVCLLRDTNMPVKRPSLYDASQAARRLSKFGPKRLKAVRSQIKVSAVSISARKSDGLHICSADEELIDGGALLLLNSVSNLPDGGKYAQLIRPRLRKRRTTESINRSRDSCQPDDRMRQSFTLNVNVKTIGVGRGKRRRRNCAPEHRLNHLCQHPD